MVGDEGDEGLRAMRGAHQGDRGDETEGGEEGKGGGGKRGEGKLSGREGQTSKALQEVLADLQSVKNSIDLKTSAEQKSAQQKR